MELLYLSIFVYVQIYAFYFVFVTFIKDIFIVLGNRFKTNKNPDKNPDLPMDFKNSRLRTKSLETFVKCL